MRPIRRDPLRALSAAVAEARRALEADTLTDPDEIVRTIGQVTDLLTRLRLARIDAEIRSVVEKRPGVTCNDIALAVAGDRPRVLKRIKALAARGLIRKRDGSQGRREWFGAKTSAVLPTARATA